MTKRSLLVIGGFSMRSLLFFSLTEHLFRIPVDKSLNNTYLYEILFKLGNSL